ncbi:hypothetical protein [Alcaligenes aquatilis]|uniref:hypothetical protein n=1 Tax=Alcaligenes aquatilis TaxID=323284 RepID=UPI0013CF179B|nr:hypothetical protein [Alcaligenes aquatilis]
MSATLIARPGDELSREFRLRPAAVPDQGTDAQRRQVARPRPLHRGTEWRYEEQKKPQPKPITHLKFAT